MEGSCHYTARLEAMATLNMSGGCHHFPRQDKAWKKIHSLKRKASHKKVDTQRCLISSKCSIPLQVLEIPLKGSLSKTTKYEDYLINLAFLEGR